MRLVEKRRKSMADSVREGGQDEPKDMLSQHVEPLPCRRSCGVRPTKGCASS